MDLPAFQQRFADIDSHIHAFVDEPSRFARLQRELTDAPAGVLTGVLLGVKDIIHVNGLPTHAGSLVPPEVLAGPEAACVTALKQAGAVVVGKTVTTEFAWFAPGPTRNPHNLHHTPGGSSSGSAAAVAAGLCDLALGTQTGGSVIRPSAFCGIFGFKPTYDRIAISGVIPFSRSVDTVGLMARELSLITEAAAVVCDRWQRLAAPPTSPVLGVPVGPYLDHVGGEGGMHFEKTIDRLTRAGLTVKRIEAMENHAEIAAIHHDLIAAEMAQVHQEWIKTHGDVYRPQTRDMIAHGRGITADRLKAAQDGRAVFRSQMQSLMDANNLDAWVCPASAGAAPKGIDTTGSPVMNSPWTYAGMPAITVPAGANAAGLPLGLQLVARGGADEALLAVAANVAPLLGE